MTGDTSCRCQIVVPIDVARGALHLDVRTRQRECGFGVIKRGGHPA